MEKRILLIEEEVLTAIIIREGLEFHGFTVDVARDERRFLTLADKIYSLALISASIAPSGPESILETIRNRNPGIPVILMTYTINIEIVNSLQAGYNDFIRKPFLFYELLQKIIPFFSLDNTGDHSSVTGALRIGSFVLYVNKRQLVGFSQVYHLSIKEFQLLIHLCRRPNNVVSHATLLNQIWGSQDRLNKGALIVYINRIRKYLRADRTISICSIWGIGYKLIIEVE